MLDPSKLAEEHEQTSKSIFYPNNQATGESYSNQQIVSIKSVKEHAKKLNRLSTETQLRPFNDVSNKQNNKNTAKVML
jgi:hypothetical protein